MTHISEKHYQKFNPQERINLTMAALARNDVKEADHLWDSCPVFTYRVRDLEYSSRMINITMIGSLFFEKCVRHYNIIKRADEYISTIECEFENPVDSEKILKKVFEARDIHIVQLKSLYKGVTDFCDQIGLCSEDFLKTVPIKETCFEIDSILAINLEINDIYVQHEKRYFLDCWPC